MNNPLMYVDPTGMNDCEEHVDCNDSPDTGPQPGQDLNGGEPLCDVVGCDIWDSRPTIGLGGGGSFDWMNVPLVLQTQGWIPWTSESGVTGNFPGGYDPWLYWGTITVPIGNGMDVWAAIIGNSGGGGGGGSHKKASTTPNFEANQQCQSQYIGQKYGAGAPPFVSHFSLLSFGSPNNSGPAVVTTVLVEAAKFGTVGAMKLAGASEVSLSAAGAATALPTVVATGFDIEAKSVCRYVSGANNPFNSGGH